MDQAALDFQDAPLPPDPPARPDPDEVRRFARAGVRMNRLPARRKKPEGRDAKNWQRGRDAREVARHVAHGGNFSVLCGQGLGVLDVDPRNGGQESLAALEARLGVSFADFPTVRTGGEDGGCHIYMSVPHGGRFRTALREFPGLEFRASPGLYVVGPSCLHPSGGQYTWDRYTAARFDFAPEDAGPRDWLTPAPAALLELYAKTRTEPAPEAEPEPLERIQAALAALPVTDFRAYSDWLQVGMAVHAASGGDPDALGAWAAWSARDPKYAGEAAAACAEKWETFRTDGGVGAGTLFALAKGYSGAVPATPPEADFAEDLLEPEAPAAAPASSLLTVGEFLERVRPAPPIIEGLLYGSGVHVLFGPWGLGKTYVALDLALHVSLRRDAWHGRPLYLGGRVAFLAAEGEYALWTRLQAFGVHWEVDVRTADLRLRPGGLDLSSSDARAAVLRDLEGAAPSLVVLDTLAAAMGAGDENSARDVGVVLAWCREVHRRTGAAVLVVHHPGHRNQGHARGSSAIEANTDGVLVLKRPTGAGRGRFALTPKKVRCGRPSPPLALRLLSVELGEDPERPGRQIVDSVVTPDTSVEPELQALAEAVREAGDALPLAAAADLVAELRGVKADSARKWLQGRLQRPETDGYFFGLRLDGDVIRLAPDEDQGEE